MLEIQSQVTDVARMINRFNVAYFRKACEGLKMVPEKGHPDADMPSTMSIRFSRRYHRCFQLDATASIVSNVISPSASAFIRVLSLPMNLSIIPII